MMLLLTGGSACGKSSYAESLCLLFPRPRWYIAAMRPYGEGSEAKIRRHRQMRAGKGFETFERYTNLAGLKLPQRGTALLECICNLTANEMFDDKGHITDPCASVLAGIEALQRQCENLVIVTNDVGSDNCAYDTGTRAYIRAVGTINAALAQRADAVYEMVCGIPFVLKGELLR